MNIKNYIFLVFVMLLMFSGCFNSSLEGDTIEKISLSPDGKYYLTIINQPSRMSFGSDNHELRLYSINKILGKYRLGEFPLEIEKWDIENNEIVIKIFNKFTVKDEYFEHHDQYIRNWIENNAHIGKFKLSFHIIYENFIKIQKAR